jgi:formiminotetrahydrofolate cyclodeaminase
MPLRVVRLRSCEVHASVLSATAILEFTRRLSSADPTPGGGSASALVGALGAALAGMVARLTAKSPKFASVAQRMAQAADEADGLSKEFLAAIDEDVVAFDKVSAAYRMPKQSDAEKRAREQALQPALVVATDVPMRVVELATSTVKLALELVEAGNPNAISDAGCAALFAQAAARGAALNVRINIKSLADATLAASYEARLGDMLAQIGLRTEVAIVKVERSVERN